MDGQLNEVEYAALVVQGFPSLALFAPGEGGGCVMYDGARDFESLVALVDDARRGATPPEQPSSAAAAAAAAAAAKSEL